MIPSFASMLSVCPHDCPSCCSLVVAVSDGRLTSVKGNPDHPFTQGVICGKVREYAERVHSPLRVLRPLRRVGPKGAGEFMPMSWDDAIETIAARWRAITAADGAEAILPFSYAGSMGQVQYFAGHPLFHALGASRLDRSICVSTAYAGWRVTVGQITGNDSEQMVGADLVVLWGVNASYSTINVMTLVKQARARGAHIVAVDPYRTATAQLADEHLMVRPGTGARHHARARSGGSRRPRLPRARHARLRPARRARADLLARGRRAGRRTRRRDHRPVRAPLRRHAADLHPGRHRHLAPRQWRDDVPHARVPARAHRRLRGFARRRAALDGRRLWIRLCRAGAPRSPADAGPPHDQHDPARTRPDGPDTGATGALTLRLQLEPGGRVPGPDARAPRARAGGSLHGRPRAGDDRHRALRRHRAAGDDLDGAPRSLLLVRPAHRAARAAGPAAAGRSEVQLGDVPAPGPRDARRGGALRAGRRRADPRVPRPGRRHGTRHHVG